MADDKLGGTPPSDSSTASDEDVCRYLAEMLIELREMAKGRTRLRLIGYMLAAARVEAGRIARGEDR